MSGENNFSSALSTMSSIANCEDLTSNEIETSDVSLNKFKLFLVAQAKNELRRIVKLTNFLDQVEDNFINTANDLMAEYPDNIDLISETMKTLMACINRSNDLISAVMSDDKLNSFVFNINTGDSQNDKFGLDIDSRTRVRDSANKLLAMLTSKADEPVEKVNEDNTNSNTSEGE